MSSAVCMTASDVFKLLNSKYKKLDLTVGASFFEIYSGKVIVFDIFCAEFKNFGWLNVL